MEKWILDQVERLTDEEVPHMAAMIHMAKKPRRAVWDKVRGLYVGEDGEMPPAVKSQVLAYLRGRVAKANKSDT